MKVLILEPFEFPDTAINLMTKHGFIVCKSEIYNCSDVEVIFVRLSIEINKSFIKKFKNLKYIVSPTTGLNHIDTHFAAEKEIDVISFYDDKTVLKDIKSTTELSLGILIALMRKIPQSVSSVQNGEWNRNPYKGYDINKKKVLIVGFGRLGKQIAKVYDALGAKVTIFDKQKNVTNKYPQINNLLNNISKFDIISIHLSLDSTSKNLLDKNILSQINNNAFVLNTSRGEVLDQNHLFWMVRNNKIKGIALDVVSEELGQDTKFDIVNLIRDCPDKVVITPHIGGFTYESLEFVEIEITKKMLVKMRFI